MRRAAAVGALVLAALLALLAARPTSSPPPPSPTPRAGVEAAPAPPRRRLGIGYLQEEAGLRVHLVLPGGPGERAGLRRGDLLVAIVDGGDAAPLGAAAGGAELLRRHLDAATDAGPLLLRVAREGEAAPRDVRITPLAEGSFEGELARRLLDHAVAELIAERRPDGLWPDYLDPTRPSVAVTALAAHALRRAGDAAGARAAWVHAVDLLLRRRGPDGGLVDPAARFPHRTYATALLTLALAGDPERGAAVEGLAAWLAAAQVQEIHGVPVFDWRYGGWSYYGSYEPDLLRTDVSTARFALEALAAAGLPDDHPAWQRARLFLEETQNRTTVTRPDEPLHAREAALRDGGFGFTPRTSKAGTEPVGDLLGVPRSYGSATADGLLALLALEGLDARGRATPPLPVGDAAAALAWLARRYDLGGVPGFDDAAAGWRRGLRFYYLAGLAEALDRAGVWRVRRRDGSDRVWAAEVVVLLANLHAARGRFVNPSGLMHEDRPALAAAFAALALAAARDRLEAGGGADLRPGPPAAAPPREVTLAAPPADAAARGRALFQRLGCVGCHAAGAANGPPLDGIGALYLARLRTPDAAGARLRRFLRDPGGVGPLRPGAWPARMPPVTATAGEVDDLVAYLLGSLGR